MDDRNQNEVHRTDRNRSNARRKKGPDYRLAYIVGAALVLILIIVGIILGTKSCAKKEVKKEVPTEAPVTVEEPTFAEPETVPEVIEDPAEKEREAELASYQNLGIIQVSDGGYLNMREQPNTSSAVIGKIYNHSACSIEQGTLEDEWVLVSSGGFKGYVKSEFLVAGDEAKNLAMQYFSKRAIITADVLNVRAEPEADANVLDKVYQGERYEVQGEPEGWIRIDKGYISAEFVEIKECLNEARKANE